MIQLHHGRSVGVALVGLLVVAAITVAAGSGRTPVMENTASSVRMLTKAEVAEVSERFPKLGPQPEGIARLGSDLLERLFPGSSFYRAYRYDIDPEFPYLVATSGDKLLMMPDGFNRLLHEHGVKVTDKNIMEMAEAFALLVMANASISVRLGVPARLDTFPPVTFLEAKRTKMVYGGSSYEAELKMRIGGQDEEWYFEVGRGQFWSVVRRNTKGVTIDFYTPIPVESPPGQGQLDPPTPSIVVDSGACVKPDTTKHAPQPAGGLRLSLVASAPESSKEQETTVSLRLITASEVMAILQKFPEMVPSYWATHKDDGELLARLFGFSEVSAAPLKRVFPAARFYQGRGFTLPPSPYLMAVAGDKRYAMPEEFNRLLIDNGLKVTDKNVAELAEAFVVAAIAEESRSLPGITFLGATRTKLKADLPTDDAAILKVKTGEQTEEWHFSVLRGQFEGAARVNGKGLITDFPSVIVESLPGQGQLNPTPDVPKHQK